MYTDAQKTRANVNIEILSVFMIKWFVYLKIYESFANKPFILY